MGLICSRSAVINTLAHVRALFAIVPACLPPEEVDRSLLEAETISATARRRGLCASPFCGTSGRSASVRSWPPAQLSYGVSRVAITGSRVSTVVLYDHTDEETGGVREPELGRQLHLHRLHRRPADVGCAAASAFGRHGVRDGVPAPCDLSASRCARRHRLWSAQGQARTARGLRPATARQSERAVSRGPPGRWREPRHGVCRG